MQKKKKKTYKDFAWKFYSFFSIIEISEMVYLVEKFGCMVGGLLICFKVG